MANHALPTLASLYTDFISNFKDRIDDVCKGFDPAFTTPTNIPADTIRWNSATSRHEKYNGTAWISLTSQYEIKVADSNKLNGQLASYYAVASDTTTAINAKVNITDIVNNLTSTDTTKPLSANQGKVLKGFIDSINTILTSSDTSLDSFQEIVAYIKQNKTVLDTLAISNIAGLVSALAGKLGVNDTAANANKLIGKNWNWSGQGGQPNWLWGGSDGTNMYVYNPANFSVNYANNAGVANSISTAVAISATAGANTGEIGTYAFLRRFINVMIYPGNTVAGGDLAYADQDSGVGGSPTGTWKCMGCVNNIGSSVFLRIA